MGQRSFDVGALVLGCVLASCGSEPQPKGAPLYAACHANEECAPSASAHFGDVQCMLLAGLGERACTLGCEVARQTNAFEKGKCYRNQPAEGSDFYGCPSGCCLISTISYRTGTPKGDWHVGDGVCDQQAPID